MPDRFAPAYRFRGSVCPSEQVARPVAVHRQAAATTSGSGTASKSATIDLFDVIDSYGGWWGISAGDVDQALAQVGDVDTLYVRLNSPGGEALEGVAIGNLLRAHAATVRITVYGLAASAASAIAMSGDVVNMAPGSMMMVHDAWNIVLGNPDELRAEAAILDKLSDGYAALYATRAGGTAAEWRERMRAESWYTADEAVEAKLADTVAVDPAPSVTPAEQSEPGLSDSDFGFDHAAKRFDLSVFRHAPAAHAAPQTPAADADGSTTHEGSAAVAFTDEQLTTMRQQLGVASDADEATILAALGEALAESAADPPAAATTTAPPAAAAIPEGKVLVSQNVLDELQSMAQAGAAARAKQLGDERDDAIASAFAEGKISADRRDAWKASWDKDPEGTKADLESLPARFPVAKAEGYQGHDGAAGDSTKPFTDDEADALGALAGLPKGALR